MKPYLNDNDFLQDDLFIYWRIQPSKELDEFWAEFLRKNEYARKPFNEAISAFDTIRNEQERPRLDNDLLVKRLHTRIEEDKKERKRRRLFVSSVAAVLFILLASTLFVLNKNEEPLISEVTIGKVTNENSVRLLSGGNVLDLDNNAELHLTENRAVVQDSLTRQGIDLPAGQTNTLIVPFGKRSSIFLADGSRVYLNSGTEMEFPSSFTGQTREIKVTGEVFIEVAKGEKPFILHTPNSRVTVYGTSFNISSYADEKSESIVLVNGSVKVTSMNSSLILKPNEMAEIENGTIQHRMVDVAEYISWKNGYMQLNKTPLNEVLMKIGRYYNIEFTYSAGLALNHRTCSGKLYLSDNLDDVLEAFSKMTYLGHERISDRKIAIVQK
jgi:transmembrane sensor